MSGMDIVKTLAPYVFVFAIGWAAGVKTADSGLAKTLRVPKLTNTDGSGGFYGVGAVFYP